MSGIELQARRCLSPSLGKKSRQRFVVDLLYRNIKHLAHCAPSVSVGEEGTHSRLPTQENTGIHTHFI